jgi:uncharacterized membrane protein
MRRATAMALIGGGLTLMISATANLVSAVWLLEPSDAAALGFSRSEVYRWYSGGLVAGALMVGWGFWRRRGERK